MTETAKSNSVFVPCSSQHVIPEVGRIELFADDDPSDTGANAALAALWHDTRLQAPPNRGACQNIYQYSIYMDILYIHRVCSGSPETHS